MINTKELTGEWIQKTAKRFKADPLLTEKVIHALLLLEGLVKQKLPFVFKGGTSLMLHFNSEKRLSIDIDIILSERETDIEQTLQAIVDEQMFTRFELNERIKRSNIEKAHYKLFYTPKRDVKEEEEFILLDILYEEVYYSNMVQLPIQSHFLPQQGEPLLVDVPTVENLLGDKLTTFAPNTTGIPYLKGGDNQSMEIIKQLYDIGTLFDVAEDFNPVKETFQKFAATELAYRDFDENDIDAVLHDIYQTSLSICTRGMDGESDFKLLQDGINRITGYIFSESYYIDKAITHASKAAYLATLLKHNVDSFDRFDPSINMKDWVIEQPFNTRVNKLKKSDPEAFFYWYKMYEMSKH
jgi:hypothetical protein